MFYALLLFSLLPSEYHIKDSVDKVEINHFYSSDTGLLVFVQVIYWDWNVEKSRWDVVDWLLDKERTRRYVGEELHQKQLEHEQYWKDYYTDIALKAQTEPLIRKNIKFTVNREKFQEWYLENFEPKIPPFDGVYFGCSEMSTPHNNKLTFTDQKHNCKREIEFKILVHTHTLEDPELKHREILPQEQRRELTPKRVKFGPK